jgi:hypothetical protein
MVGFAAGFFNLRQSNQNPAGKKLPHSASSGLAVKTISTAPD